MDSAQSETVPWLQRLQETQAKARGPLKPPTCDLQLREGVPRLGVQGAPPPAHSGLGEGCPSCSLEGKVLAGGWGWAGVGLLGANASSA